MKKEIEGYVLRVGAGEDYVKYEFFQQENGNISSIYDKAKLIIEIPEKSVTITESQFRECFDTFQRLDNDNDRRLVYSFHEFSKQRLFGKES